MRSKIKLPSYFYYLLLLGLFSLPSTTLAQEHPWIAKMTAYGLLDIQSISPKIKVALMYNGTDNFTNADIYEGFDKAYLHPDFATKIAKAQTLLEKEKGDRYTLIIYDAARPFSVQRIMWNLVKGTPKQKYVAPLTNGGGRHNYGMAVDMSIYDNLLQQPLDMGSPVDHFGEKSHVGNEAELYKRGLITKKAYDNRRFFHQLLKRVGLHPIRKEWWHIEEQTPMPKIRAHYPLLDF